MTDTAVPDKVTRRDVEDAQKLLRHARNVLLKAIEQGNADKERKKQLREKIAAGAFVIDNAAADVERYAPKVEG